MNRENYVEPMVADSKGNLYVSMKYHKENIENLQEEIDDLKNRLENAVADCNLKLQETKDLQQRIDKAIDYIEKHSNKTSEYLDVWEVKELLEILKGETND